MENKKQSLYTKYRPQTFDQVIGQNIAKEILINSINKNKINHAYLFYGIRGTGKTTLARIFAKSINCENPINHNPCNNCSMCTSINNGSAFDVIEIDAASNNGVDEIRTIKENTTFLTTSSKYKVYIIDEVHMLSKAAFNALLKTLEEPPKNTIFLLATTELHKIPQTVLSRTVVINLQVMSNNDIKQGLEVVLQGEDKKYEVEALDYITMTSGGSLRDAITALETTLLYNDELSTQNIISSLGLIDKNTLRELLNNNIDELINRIDDSDKDPKKISLLILEEIMHFIKNGDKKFTTLVNLMINAVNTIKDPLLLRIAIKSALYSINVSHETMIETQNVSRETLKNNELLKSENSENVEKEGSEQEVIDIQLEKPNKIVEITMENLVENPLKPVDKNIDNNVKIEENVLNLNETIENNEGDITETTEELEVIVETIQKDEENTPIIEKEVEPLVNEVKMITDFVDVNNYLYVIKNNDSELLQKIANRWNLRDSYSNREEFVDIISTLTSTQPLATTDKTLIIGFRDQNLIEEYKKHSLTQEFFSFINELIGNYKFILPVNEETWSKLIAVNKNNPTTNEKEKEITLNFTDFIKTKTEEVVLKASALFGEENIINE